MKRTSTILLALALTLSALTLVSQTPTTAQTKEDTPAKNFDLGLLKAAPKIAAFLSGKGYESVGVLPFQVKKGERTADYDAAPLCASLPTRIENALIMTMDPNEETALKVIRDAGATALSKKVGAWTKEKAAFEKLFTIDYPLGYGKATAKPDVFLTGTVENTGDRKVTKVSIVGFTKEDWEGKAMKPFPITTFTVRTDRLLLRDLGYSFVVARAVNKRGLTSSELDRDAVEKVYKDEQGNGDEDSKAKPVDVAGMRFDILYDGVKQTIRPLGGASEGAKSPVFQVDPIKEGTKVTFGLTRVSGEGKRLGVVIKLNGVSIYQMDKRDSLQCLKWLFDPADKDTMYKFGGFQMDPKGDEVYPFQVLTAAKSAEIASELGARAGWLDIDVFASGEEGSATKDEEDQLVVSTRGMPRTKEGKPSDLKELHKKLLAMNNVSFEKDKAKKTGKRGLIVHELKPVRGPELKQQRSMPNPIRLGGISIKYYDRSSDNSQLTD